MAGFLLTSSTATPDLMNPILDKANVMGQPPHQLEILFHNDHGHFFLLYDAAQNGG